MRLHANGRAGNVNGPSRYDVATSADAITPAIDAPEITMVDDAPPMALSRYGSAFPTVSAPTNVPIAKPRAERNQVATIFMPGGYTPAMNIPVRKRTPSAPS